MNTTITMQFENSALGNKEKRENDFLTN